MSKKWRQSSKLLEPGSFDMYKKAVAPIIVMLGYSEVDTEVSNVNMETVESNKYRGISKDNRDANGVLATTWEIARFFHKDR